MTTDSVSFRFAKPGEARVIADLVNSAYRGDSSRAGWTTEADLLEGLRTDEAGVRKLIDEPDSMILLCVQREQIVGSVHLREENAGAYLGLFVVKPSMQGAGIGSMFMRAAEEIVRSEWGAKRMTMSVISVRHELIAFYQRRGYQRTGRTQPFPTDAGLSVALVQGLEFAEFAKDLTASD